MDEKTEQLRDIFLDVADEATVTEHQEETHGSLATDEDVDDRLRALIETMRERYDLDTSLSTDDLVTVVRGYFAGQNDTEIARELGDDSLSKTVSRARVDLHLLRERDTDAPFDLDDLRDLVDAGHTVEEVADELGVSASTVRRYRRILRVREEIRTTGERFPREFESLLEDRDLADRMTAEVQQDGLDEATEGLETNVSF